ncbi:copper transport protein CCH isoform X2 [Brassica rapa]|uniref:copper transport protein CCH isoform X2 n=1 Tax=Brassica campestris TaxID=3711 RepID=UPI0004F14E5B|nr:copper transport protein CCH isoform X2 [Brassica rapa]
MSQTVVLKVGMSCQGCVGAVNRVLGKMEGVESFDIDIKEQKVTVKGRVEPEAVFQTVSKTGKKTSYWPVETEAEPKAEVEPKAETETNAEAETKTEETETKTEGKADDEVLDAKVDPKVDAKADVEPKLVEAETKPPQV